MYFDFGRKEGFPTQYGPNQTPVTVDVLEAGFICAALILIISLYISIIGTKFCSTVCLYTNVTLSLFIGLLLLLGNFGQEWEVAEIKSRTAYKAGNHAEIYATIGLKIGLRSVNITLKSDVNSNSSLKKEIINYNERFHWTWDQGRFGFGPYAGLLQREFREAQYRGAPLPILWVADYFVIDGEGFRHGRFYRTAGWYTHIALWSAFPCWLLANLFFRSVIRYGGYCLMLTGIFQLVGNLLWIVIRNPNPLVIPFEDATLITKLGISYWITFSCGILCVVLGFIILLAPYIIGDDNLHIFFGVDVLTNTDEKYVSSEEYEEYEMVQRHTIRNRKDDELELVNVPQRNRSIKLNRQKSIILSVRKNTNSVIRQRAFNNEHIYGNTRRNEPPIYENLTYK